MPSAPAISDAPASAMTQLRERCRGLGLPTWRCDNSGLILAEPDESGPAALLLGTPTVAKLIGQAVRDWGSAEDPQVVELFKGCWAIPLLEVRRRARVGVTVALAFSHAALHSDVFLAACASALLDPQAIRRTMLPRARFDLDSSRGLRDLLLWMAQDLSRIEEHDRTLSGFTRQLTDCFETIDLLYTLGRSMNDLTQPVAFVQRLCERVRTTLGFGWLGAWFAPTTGALDGIAGQLLFSGDLTIPTDRIAETSPELLRLAAQDPKAVILTEIAGQPIAGAGQILSQPVLRAGRPVGVVLAGDKSGDDPQVSSYDIQLLEAAAGYIGAFLDNAVLYADQQALFLGTLEALTASIDAKDRYTCGHSQRVAHLAWQLALATGMPAEQADRVRIAGLVHDVGKIGVPEAVLCKQGRLTDEEFDAIKRHPEIGHHILKDIPLLADVLPGVLHHHERWDGRGYPHGISGEQIPLMARLIAVADTFDAMSSTRSYRAAMPRSTVLTEIQRCAGSQFDPQLTAVFCAMDLTAYDQMVTRHSAEAGVTPSPAEASEAGPSRAAA